MGHERSVGWNTNYSWSVSPYFFPFTSANFSKHAWYYSFIFTRPCDCWYFIALKICIAFLLEHDTVYKLNCISERPEGTRTYILIVNFASDKRCGFGYFLARIWKWNKKMLCCCFDYLNEPHLWYLQILVMMFLHFTCTPDLFIPFSVLKLKVHNIRLLLWDVMVLVFLPRNVHMPANQR